MRFHRVPQPGIARAKDESTSVARLADVKAGVGRPHRGDGLSAAIALLTATVPMPGSPPQARDETLLAAMPEDGVDLIDLFAGLHAVAHVLLLELSAVSDEPLTAPLQRLAMASLAGRDDR